MIFAVALEGRMLDINDRVRIQAVTTACELAMCNMKRAPPELISQVIERLRDRKVWVFSTFSNKETG